MTSHPDAPDLPETDSGRALIVVDVQNDFCEGGSLAVAGGTWIAEQIADYLSSQQGTYAAVVGTRDWHIDPGEHFAPTPPGPDYVSTWPQHCVVGSGGAASHPALDDVIANGLIHAWFHKGEHSAAYSGFEGTLALNAADGDQNASSGDVGLAQWLRQHEVAEVDVIGIATDYCVKATALDAVAAGFTTRVLLDLTAGVSVATTKAAIEEMADAGVMVIGQAIVRADA